MSNKCCIIYHPTLTFLWDIKVPMSPTRTSLIVFIWYGQKPKLWELQLQYTYIIKFYFTTSSTNVKI